MAVVFTRGLSQRQHFARRFPELRPLPRTTSPVDPLRLSFEELWAKLQAGHCSVLDGNPIKVTDLRSPLRSMQAKDDYDHAVFVHTARADRAFVMDPLGRGPYQGAWVPKVDLRQFASRFTTPSGSPYGGLVKRGDQSRVERVRRATRERALVQARDAVEALRRTA